MSNKNSHVTVPAEQIQTLNCPSCHATLHYYTVAKQFPHLYCTHCHNAYVELAAQAICRKVHTDGGAEKIMSRLQSSAPLCECGGMFLFNVGVHCVHCGEMLPLPLPPKGKLRLWYDQLVIFHDTTVYYDKGKKVSYRLTA